MAQYEKIFDPFVPMFVSTLLEILERYGDRLKPAAA